MNHKRKILQTIVMGVLLAGIFAGCCCQTRYLEQDTAPGDSQPRTHMPEK